MKFSDTETHEMKTMTITLYIVIEINTLGNF